jgi:hypothetical protein
MYQNVAEIPDLQLIYNTQNYVFDDTFLNLQQTHVYTKQFTKRFQQKSS